jgi:hypothetical protein
MFSQCATASPSRITEATGSSRTVTAMAAQSLLLRVAPKGTRSQPKNAAAFLLATLSRVPGVRVELVKARGRRSCAISEAVSEGVETLFKVVAIGGGASLLLGLIGSPDEPVGRPGDGDAREASRRADCVFNDLGGK